MNNTHSSYVTWAEVDLKAIRHNLRELQRLAASNRFFIPGRPRIKKFAMSSSQILAVVKADAYGHGMLRVAKVLEKAGVGFLAVSDVTEGVALRKSGIKKPILLFESTLSSQAKEIIDYQLTPTVCTLALASSLNRYAQRRKKRINIHIKVDTGMGRLGVWHKEAFDFIEKINRDYLHLTIQGIYTHFPVADTDKKFTNWQIHQLYDLIKRLDKHGLIIPYIHASNSMGLAGYKTHILNIARPGLMIYGLYPRPSLRKKVRLKPALRIKSKVIFLKDIEKGRSISYGRTFIAKKRMKVATIPIGYNDGYFRSFSNKANMLIGGVHCPVLGRVTMDQTVVDVSKVRNARLDMPVTILGEQSKNSISADELAGFAKTINYEIVCSLGNRLPRKTYTA